jgi:hypothetical protein
VLTDIREMHTFIKRIRWHVWIRLSERDTVECVGYVEGVRLSRYKLMDMPAVSHYTFSVSDVKISCHFVDCHVPINSTSLSLDGISEWVDIVTNTLF